MNTAMRTRIKSTNISLDAALVEEAKMLNINLSATLNTALEDIVRRKRQARWKEENRETIAATNRFTEEHAIPASRAGLRVIK